MQDIILLQPCLSLILRYSGWLQASFEQKLLEVVKTDHKGLEDLRVLNRLLKGHFIYLGLGNFEVSKFFLWLQYLELLEMSYLYFLERFK